MDYLFTNDNAIRIAQNFINVSRTHDPQLDTSKRFSHLVEDMVDYILENVAAECGEDGDNPSDDVWEAVNVAADFRVREILAAEVA